MMKWVNSIQVFEIGKSGEMGSRKGCFDWLPAGWKMDIRSRSTGKTDRFYIDPVSGYAFRSMNEVFRYLETGKIGRRVFKHKDTGDSMIQKSRNRPLYSTGETQKQKSRRNSKPWKLHPEYQNTESDSADAEDHHMQTVDLQKLASLLPWGSNERCTEFVFPMDGELVVNLRIENPVENTREQMKIIPNQNEEVSTDESEGVHDNSENDADKEDDDVSTWSAEYILEEDDNPGVNDNQGHEHQEIPLSSASASTSASASASATVSATAIAIATVSATAIATVSASASASATVSASASASATASEGLWNDPCIEFAIKTLKGEMPIVKDAKVSTIPGALMGFQNEKRPFDCQDMRKDSVKTSTGNANKEQVGGNAIMQQKCSTKSGGGLSWPTFADYRVTKFSWANSGLFPQKF